MFKFLDPTGCTYHDGQAFQYNLPQRGQTWGDWTEHPEPAEPDGNACGPGRLHLMKTMSARYAPANLGYADLRYANLGGANLWDADLGYADLAFADLRGAHWNEYTAWPEGFAPVKEDG